MAGRITSSRQRRARRSVVQRAASDAPGTHRASARQRTDGHAPQPVGPSSEGRPEGIRGLAASLKDSFLALTRGRRTALARYQTMRATLACSG
jgi:hypothetical protein